MKYIIILPRLICLCVLIIFLDCKKDDAPAVPTGRSKSYVVTNTDLSTITGTVTFIENENNSTTINFSLQNSSENVDNAIILRRKTAFQGGGEAVSLGKLDGATGKGSFTISKLKNGDAIDYDKFLDFDGYLAIYMTDSGSGELAAYSDIGRNEFTGNEKVYSLFNDENVYKGQVTFSERIKGTTAAIVGILDSNSTQTYASHIHDSQNEILFTFSVVEERLNGNGFTEISEIDGTTVSYSDIIELNAVVDVHDADDPSAILVSGGIGANPTAIELE